eukprot:5673237-Pyramimonas_sp.AAC.1
MGWSNSWKPTYSMISASDWSEPRSADPPRFPPPLGHCAGKCASPPQVLHVMILRQCHIGLSLRPLPLPVACVRPLPLALPLRNESWGS